MTEIHPFRVAIPDSVLDDLRGRVRATRWIDPGLDGWSYGASQAYLKDLLTTWFDFDWRSEEDEINRLPQFTATVDGREIHFVYRRGSGSRPLPIVLTSGWPSCFLEYRRIIDLLCEPAAHGGDPDDAFDVIAPSQPGFGFSPAVREPGYTWAETADLWVGLMDALGYERFAVHGSDIGARVSSRVGMIAKGRVAGVHLTAATFSGPPENSSPPPTEAEREFTRAAEEWEREEGAYSEIQATKPATLAAGLNDSPAGLAAWILEKWRSWSDSGGELESRFARSDILANLTVYWAAQTIEPSVRLYYEHRKHLDRLANRVEVPVGIALFHNEFVREPSPPRELVERTHNVVHWQKYDSGGHFPAMEEPKLLAADIRAFFRGLR